MDGFVANTIAAISATGSIFLLIDFLLSDHAKKVILHHVTKLWFWLDDAKKWRTFDWLRGRPLLLFSFGMFVSALVLSIAGWAADGIFLSLGFLALLVPAAMTGPAVLRIVVGGTRYGYLILPVVLVMISLNIYDLVRDLNGPQLGVVRILLIGYFFTFTAFAVLACLPLWLIPAVKILLRGLELVVRRLAEYPKGPLLGVSAVLGAFAGAIKSFF